MGLAAAIKGSATNSGIKKAVGQGVEITRNTSANERVREAIKTRNRIGATLANTIAALLKGPLSDAAIKEYEEVDDAAEGGGANPKDMREARRLLNMIQTKAQG